MNINKETAPSQRAEQSNARAYSNYAISKIIIHNKLEKLTCNHFNWERS